MTKKRAGAVVAQVLALFLLRVAIANSQGPPHQEVPENLAPHPAPAQPLPYSHKSHLALGLTCQNCHTNPDPGSLMTFPAASRCMQCHVNVDKDQPVIQKLQQFAKSGRPIPWVRVYQLTPGVNWSHRKHIQAGMQCVMCHGQVAEVDAMTEATGVTSMASCIACHRANNASTACKTCHPWPSE